PLQQVAEVSIKTGPSQIQRENAQRRISVGFNVRGRDVESIVNEVQQKVEKGLKLPAGYYITYGGQFENLRAAKRRLSIAVPVSLLLILMMLHFAFGSLKQGLLVYSAIPLSAIGGVFALLIRGMPFSISAGIGFIALFGVAVLNGIVLITEFNQLKQAGVRDIKERVLKGTRIRLRPVLMTAAVASLGFLPMALSNGAGAEVQRPLATVVIGGLVTATLLTLFVLPVLYMWSERAAPLVTKPHPIRKRPKIKKRLLPVLFFLLVQDWAGAQVPVTLQAALDTAYAQNLSVQAARLKTGASRALEGSAIDLPLTSTILEYGSINSAYGDTRLGITQSFSFPVVYKRQRALLEAQTKSYQLNEEEVKLRLRKEIASLYYQILLMQEERDLLMQSDSLFAASLQKQEQRFRVGDINIVQKTAAETQRMQIANQLQQLDADLAALQVRFSSLIRAGGSFVPVRGSVKAVLLALPDTAVAVNHPLLRTRQQQQQVARSELEVQRSKLLPQLSLGYVNQSFRGVQNVDGVEKHYTARDRFSSVLAGVDIPIFARAQKARITAGRYQLDLSQVEYQETLRQLQAQREELLLQYRKAEKQLLYYEQYALKQARILREHSTLQLSSGDISYLEWMMLVHQSIQLQAGYFAALNAWNATVIELNAYADN
ncbi:MAG TPA: efflux RND transporter permease subunit, partial [Chitinophagaceae bacterium]